MNRFCDERVPAVGADDDARPFSDGGAALRVAADAGDALFQVLAEDFALRRFGRIGQGVLVLVFALSALSIDWTPDRVAVLAMAFVCGTVIYFSIFVLLTWLVWAFKVALSRRYRPWVEPYETTTTVVVPVGAHAVRASATARSWI